MLYVCIYIHIYIYVCVSVCVRWYRGLINRLEFVFCLSFVCVFFL